MGSELRWTCERKTVPDYHIKRQRELGHRKVFHTAAAQLAQAGRDQHNNQIGRSVQLLEKTDDAVAEETLGDGHRLRYFGAAAHALGETGVAGVE